MRKGSDFRTAIILMIKESKSTLAVQRNAKDDKQQSIGRILSSISKSAHDVLVQTNANVWRYGTESDDTRTLRWRASRSLYARYLHVWERV